MNFIIRLVVFLAVALLIPILSLLFFRDSFGWIDVGWALAVLALWGAYEWILKLKTK